MSEPIEIARELKAELDKLPLFIEYKRVKSLLEGDEEIKSLKKEIALAKVHHDDKLHKSLLDRYNSHPLVNNYNALQEEVWDYLKQISDIVNKK